ncbi:CHAT domain-containing protein [Streptomyces sp. NPDC018972]|uniref:CHAT domain-containing protein n=1 Tax=Streptomyces sp. NPDC018972 TaxID=3365060 RepID=UPI0037A391B9
MGDEETGGVLGLRAWAADAMERARRLVPGAGAGTSPPDHDATVAELDGLVRLLDHDAGLRGAVSVWLAGALTLRHAAGGGAPADRERAERLLREARDRRTPLGAAVSDEDRRWAALFLLSYVVPLRPGPGAPGAAPDLSALLERVTRVGPAGMVAMAAEVETLTADVMELPLPSPFLDELRRMRGVLAMPAGAGLTDLLTGMMPAGTPASDQLRRMAERLFGTDDAPTTGHADTSGTGGPVSAPGRSGTHETAAAAGPGPGRPASESSRVASGSGRPAPGSGGPASESSRVASGPGRPAPGSGGPASGPGRPAPGFGRPASGPGRPASESSSADSEPGPPAGPGDRHADVPGPRPAPEPGADEASGPGRNPGPTSPPPPPSRPPLTPDDLRRLTAALGAVGETTAGLDDVLKRGDPEALNRLLAQLRSVQDTPLPGLDATPALESLRALLLAVSPAVGGTFQDRSAGRAHIDTVLAHLEGIAESSIPGVGDPSVLGRAFATFSRILEAGETEDVARLRELVEEAEELERAVPEDHPCRFAVLSCLGAAYGRLGAVTQDKEMLLRALPYTEQGITGAKGSGLPFAGGPPPPDIPMPDPVLLRAGLTGERVAVPEDLPPEPPEGASAEEADAYAASLGLRFSHTRDPADLDALVQALERIRDEVRRGRGQRIAADALWRLAEAYHLRKVLRQDPEDTACVDAAKEALTALAADVLLQTGAEHGLLAARSGASRGLRAARWALTCGRVHEAVAALELGRALVLQAAATSSAVPELLDAAGHHELAEAWRTAGLSRGAGAAGGPGVPGELPSTLRRRALEALGYRQEDGGPLATPTLAELADGVAEAGADVLVYLVPGEDEIPGMVIAVGPHLGAGTGALPLLSGAGSGPLERYIDAADARGDGRERDPSAEQAWEDALGTLCDWAFQVLGPVLAGIEKRLTDAGRLDGRPLRAVLVPCGRLGIVPWHAARSPGDAPHRHLCETVVVSYAASGGQFLRTVGRAPRDPAAAPVLVADPTMDLVHADVEVRALRDAFYPRARLCGEVSDEPDGRLGAATPDEILALLADGASLLHVATHGSAGTRPTVSALYLAAPESTGDNPVPESTGDNPVPEGTGDNPVREAATDDAAPDTGLLTVTRLLDRTDPRRGPADGAPDGPLVVLSACETDLSNRDHDEALTLTTAFVSGGARDVVGSRWRTADSASALMMAVFHHHLTVDGLGPADALRAAQLWMLDPHRENPGSLDGELLREMERPGLDRIPLWAAFVHQGHPGRKEARTRNMTDGTTHGTTEGGNA